MFRFKRSRVTRWRSAMLRSVPLVLWLAAPAPGIADEPVPGPVIGVSVGSMDDVYTTALVDAIATVAEGHPGSTFIVTAAGADASNQAERLRSLAARPVDAIVVMPAGAETIRPALRGVTRAGIPVVAITGIPEADVLTTVDAQGDYVNGRASGDLLRQNLGGDGRLAVVRPTRDSWRTDQRLRGLHEAIADSDMQIVAVERADEMTGTRDAVARILAAHPDLAGIWCASGGQTAAAADALRFADRKGILVAGVDAEPAVIQRIEHGWVAGAATGFPSELGRLAAEAVFARLAGEPVADHYEAENILVTAENVSEMKRRLWGE